MYYRVYEEDGHFVNKEGLSYNLLFASHVYTPESQEIEWEYFKTFFEALEYYGLSVKEEFVEDYIAELEGYNDFSLTNL